MTSLQSRLMQTIHGRDIWRDHPGLEVRPQSAPQGWGGDHPSLSRLASTYEGACIIDVGVWKGDSTITLAKAMKEKGIDGCVIAVDTFLGSPEHFTNPNYRALFDTNLGRPDLYETFLSNVTHAGVRDYVVPMPQTSVTAAAVLAFYGIKAQIIHIDAAHEYAEVLRDCEIYWDLVAAGGSMIGDDYVSGWPGIIKAAGEFSARLGLPLAIEPPKWTLRKANP